MIQMWNPLKIEIMVTDCGDIATLLLTNFVKFTQSHTTKPIYKINV